VPNKIYWLNFRIEDPEETVVKPNHKKRYEDVVEIVEEYALTWWRQSPSLYIFDTNVDFGHISTLFQKCINPAHDYILIGQLGVGAENTAIFGRYNDKDIFQIVPFLKELEPVKK